MLGSIRQREWWVVAGTVVFLAGCPRATNSPVKPIELTPAVVAQHNQGVALMGQFDYVGAHAVFDNLVKKYPDWDAAKVDLAIATLNRREQGDVARAAKLLAGVIERNPDNLRAKYCRAILYRNGGQPAEALELFREVVNADPNDGYAMYYTGQCLAESSKYDEALEYFLKAQKLDPYLRSAYYGASQASQRQGNMDAAKQYLDTFLKLDDNPQARLAETKYTRMGPKATLEAIHSDDIATLDAPAGPLFANGRPLKVQGEVNWREFSSTDMPPSMTACDINGDRRIDLFVCCGLGGTDDVHNAVLVAAENGAFRMQQGHPLARVSNVTAALWGDYDNDGRVDVYLCRKGPNQLWKQLENTWQDVTEESVTSGGDVTTIDGAIFDADHDGDLDLFLLNMGAPNELLSNNLDGTFRPIAADQGIGDGPTATNGIVLADLDSDRDVDIVVSNSDAPHAVYLNDRLWKYRMAEGFNRFQETTVSGAVAVDSNVDGQVEIYTFNTNGLQVWAPDGERNWAPTELKLPDGVMAASLHGPLAVRDLDGDGRCEIICGHDGGWVVMGDTGQLRFQATVPGGPYLLAVLNEAGYSMVAPQSGAPPQVWLPGENGRYPITQVAFTGKESKADQMRTNASGIGVQAAVRIGQHWVAVDTFRQQSGVGQSLQPVPVGLRGEPQMDFVSIRWPDGLLQTEIGLAADRMHVIEEVQRQVSSCPMVFAWDGERFEFVTDVLGVAGIGYNLGRGQYSEPRPWENLLLPADLLRSREGAFAVKIGEPMEEAMYLDAARLMAYDLPPDWQMTLDERLSLGEAEPTGEPIFYRRKLAVSAATNERGQDILSEISTVDAQAASIPPVDRRFLGRTEPHTITLAFAKSLQDWAGQDSMATLYLLFDGWVEYPYSQTMFAAWQAGASYDAPTIEARGADGKWHTVWDKFGYMAGMPREATVPLPVERLPEKTTQLRISTNLEIYWDRLCIIASEPCPAARRHKLSLRRAVVSEVGFAVREQLPQRRPYYNYQRRSQFWDTRRQNGYYTRFGPADSLVADVDDALAIIGPGEEVHLEFTDSLPLAETGWQRRFVLESHGWCKDMDLYTRDGETLGPLPVRTGTIPMRNRDELHRKLNTRYQ